MSYYDTIEEDIERAKAILAKGKPAHEQVAYLPEPMRQMALAGGAIYGADVYAAYKLLESFVDVGESYQLLLALLNADDYKAAVRAIRALREGGGTPVA